MNRKHEQKLASELSTSQNIKYVIGTDEAGRGPLAGPVATSAVCLTLEGDMPVSVQELLNDSKQVNEANRRELVSRMIDNEELLEGYFQCFQKEEESPYLVTPVHASTLLGAATVLVPARVIDDKNILEASLDGMCLCAAAVMRHVNDRVLAPQGKPLMSASNTMVLIDGPHVPWGLLNKEARDKKLAVQLKAHMKKHGIANPRRSRKKSTGKNEVDDPAAPVVILPVIDRGDVGILEGTLGIGVIKGDALCPSIAAASVLAKVARDHFLENTMHPAHPEYEFKSHKGYPTALHLERLVQHGVSPYHRRSYGPVKQVLENDRTVS